jgi:hypothetical protein
MVDADFELNGGPMIILFGNKTGKDYNIGPSKPILSEYELPCQRKNW